VASAGPYTDHMHFAPDSEPQQHLIAQFLYGLDALETRKLPSIEDQDQTDCVRARGWVQGWES